MKKILSFLLCCAALAAQAQTDPIFERTQFPVKVDGHNLAYPFAGGLNAPQFSAADLNNDGKQDLVVFDRVGGTVLTFLNYAPAGSEANYLYAPEYARFFPQGLRDWVLLRDYDQDGAADIFCSSMIPGTMEVQVFRGYYEDNFLKFTSYLFEYPPSCTYCNPLLIFYPDDNPAFFNNYAVNRTDIPAIDDIDGDGDLDIIAFIAGSSTSMTMLRNMSVEKGFGLNKLQYELYDRCWGRFYEDGSARCRASLSCHPDTCYLDCKWFDDPPQADDRGDNRHPGASATTLDFDGDGDKDMVLGNTTYSCIGMLTNGGTPTNAWMVEQDTAFPFNNVPVNINSFPGSFYLDFDQDGRKDLIAALNNATSGEDRKAVWFYKNTALEPGKHQFELQTQTLLVGDMIDLGTTAHPTFADVNADGLLDLVVGNYGYYSFNNAQPIFTNSSLYLFLNVGTPTAPAFELADTDFAGLSSFAPDDFDFSPTFGDIDGDGDLDLVVGNNIGGFYCYRNLAGPNQPMVLEYDLSPMWLSMDVVGSVSAPIIYDLDEDGLPDLVVGERTGNINFFKNFGTPSNPSFNDVPTLGKIGQIDARVPPEVVGMSTPAIIKTIDGPIIVTGTQRGHLEAYYLQGATEAPFPEVSVLWGGMDEGNRSHPALADLDGDGLLEMVVGNQRGGLAMYRTGLVDYTVPIKTVVPKVPELKITPNPVRAWARMEYPVETGLSWQAFDALGQLVASGTSEAGVANLDVRDWPSGVYYIRVDGDGQHAAGRLVVGR
jgi:hypothetical protein